MSEPKTPEQLIDIFGTLVQELLNEENEAYDIAAALEWNKLSLFNSQCKHTQQKKEPPHANKDK